MTLMAMFDWLITKVCYWKNRLTQPVYDGLMASLDWVKQMMNWLATKVCYWKNRLTQPVYDRLSRKVCGEHDGEDADQNRDAFIKSFERKLTCAVHWVWVIGFLYNLSNVLDFCILCYSTWVLFPSFNKVQGQNLQHNHFLVAVGMLLVGGARWTTASFFTRLLVHPLAYQSQAPADIHHGRDEHYPRSSRYRFYSLSAQSGFAFLYLVFCFLIIIFIKREDEDTTYILVGFAGVNGIVGFITVLGHDAAFYCLSRRSPGQKSILRYFDAVLEKAITSGLAGASDFEFFHFAYTLLAGEFSRNVQPMTVARNHADMSKYLYHHRLGADFLLLFMDDKNAWVQLAATNLVGFWADQTWEAELRLPKELPKKLADKVGMGQIGWAATTCIGLLAARSSKWAETFKQTSTSNSGQSVPVYLAGKIDGFSKHSHSVVRTLVQLYEQLHRVKQQEDLPEPFTVEAYSQLLENLKKIAKGASLHRSRVQAAYLLILLMREPCNGYIKSIVKDIDPGVDAYWLESENKMLELLYRRFDLHEIRQQPKPKRIINESGKGFNPPLWVETPVVVTQ